MLRIFSRQAPATKQFAPILRRTMASKNIEDTTKAAGEAKDTNPSNPSVLSSGGAIGKQVCLLSLLTLLLPWICSQL